MAEFPRLVIARRTRHLLSRVKILLHLNDAIYPAGVPTHQHGCAGRWKPPTLPEDVVRFPKLAGGQSTRGSGSIVGEVGDLLDGDS